MIETRIVPADKASSGSRRTRNRDSLFLSATISKPGAVTEPAPVRVRNLSAIGLMADYLDLANEGDPVIVTLRGIGSVPGKVAWVKRGRIGINFDVEVDPMMARKPVAGGAPAKSAQRPL